MVTTANGPCVLVSGGLDSAVALAEAARDRGPVLPVYVRSGLVWERAERYWLDRFLPTLPAGSTRPLAVLDLPADDLYGSHWSVTGANPPGPDTPDSAVYLPGRNLLLLAKAGVLAAERDLRSIVVGSLATNPFPDGTPDFFRAIGEAIGIGMGLDGPMSIETPLAGVSKAEAIRRGAGLALELTLSCLAPTEDHRHCGACNKCAERRRGFAGAGVADPTDYAAAS